MVRCCASGSRYKLCPEAMPAKYRDPFYLTPAWKALRHEVLKRDRYYCQICKALCLGKKRGMPTPHVDHVIPRKERPDLSMSPGNLRTLCHGCHSRVTINDMHGKKKTPIGVDGFPIESA